MPEPTPEESGVPFSSDEWAGIEIDTGLAEEALTDAIEAEIEAEEAAAKPAPSEAELMDMARGIFYHGLEIGMGTAGFVLTAGSRELGPLKSLSLASYGDVGRAASDQVFDRLCENKRLKGWLLKLGNIDKLFKRYGAILKFALQVRATVSAELAAREKALKEMQAARERPAPEPGLKGEA